MFGIEVYFLGVGGVVVVDVVDLLYWEGLVVVMDGEVDGCFGCEEMVYGMGFLVGEGFVGFVEDVECLLYRMVGEIE